VRVVRARTRQQAGWAAQESSPARTPPSRQACDPSSPNLPLYLRGRSPRVRYLAGVASSRAANLLAPGHSPARRHQRTYARTHFEEHPLLLARWRRPFDHTFLPLPTTTTPLALVLLSRLPRLLLSCRRRRARQVFFTSPFSPSSTRRCARRHPPLASCFLLPQQLSSQIFRAAAYGRDSFTGECNSYSSIYQQPPRIGLRPQLPASGNSLRRALPAPPALPRSASLL